MIDTGNAFAYILTLYKWAIVEGEKYTYYTKF